MTKAHNLALTRSLSTLGLLQKVQMFSRIDTTKFTFHIGIHVAIIVQGSEIDLFF